LDWTTPLEEIESAFWVRTTSPESRIVAKADTESPAWLFDKAPDTETKPEDDAISADWEADKFAEFAPPAVELTVFPL
jgi:hypothetical protein